MSSPTAELVYEALTGEDDGRVCRDIPEAACNEQPGNFLRHVASLAATKTGDGLMDPKLVLSWLFSALDASPALIGWLVPVREAGALLPQLAIAASIRARPVRKWVWAAGSAVQGIAVLGMGAAALALEPRVAAWTILGLLVVFSLARSACSVAYKDVLGKTVAKATRGTATGTAATVAATAVLAFGAALSFGVLDVSVGTIAAALGVAGLLWLGAALVFATLAEAPGATEGGGSPLDVARSQLGLLREDPQLVRLIVARALLLATALAPPYLVSLSGASGERALGELGPFVVAASLAAVLSTYVWGRLADVSSRRVLALASLVAAIALALAATAGQYGPGALPPLALPGLLFVLMIAYQGVRLGRSTHIVDMTTAERRAAYTALSNTAIGVLLVAGGAFGLLANTLGESAVLAAMSALCAAAALVSLSLREVQEEASSR